LKKELAKEQLVKHKERYIQAYMEIEKDKAQAMDDNSLHFLSSSMMKIDERKEKREKRRAVDLKYVSDRRPENRPPKKKRQRRSEITDMDRPMRSAPYQCRRRVDKSATASTSASESESGTDNESDSDEDVDRMTQDMAQNQLGDNMDQ
jgi:hypothetical protein